MGHFSFTALSTYTELSTLIDWLWIRAACVARQCVCDLANQCSTYLLNKISKIFHLGKLKKKFCREASYGRLDGSCLEDLSGLAIGWPIHGNKCGCRHSRSRKERGPMGASICNKSLARFVDPWMRAASSTRTLQFTMVGASAHGYPSVLLSRTKNQ